MALNLIFILVALAVVMIIAISGLILTQIFINRAARVQEQANISLEQPSDIFVNMEDLSNIEKQKDVAIISNDVMKDVSHHPFPKKTSSAPNQTTRVDHMDNKNMGSLTPTQQRLERSTETRYNSSPSGKNPANSITHKITLSY